MRILLDTNVALAVGNGSEPPEVAEFVENEENDCFLSVVVLWEIAIKRSIGKLDIGMGLEEFASGFISQGYSVLNVQPKHIYALDMLPVVHRDPFDRLLVAQAQREDMMLITTDELLAEYGPLVKYIKK